MATQELLKTVRDAGVVGAGGAGFPTYKKLEATVSHVIANGAECEPLLQKDRESMRRDQCAFFRGLATMRQLTGAQRVTVAVKRKNEDLVDLMRDDAKQAGCEFFVYEDVYPAGDEYVLVYEITGRQIPPGGLPLHVDCVVDNVETIINIGKAIEGSPVTEKYVTIAGAVHRPLTTIVPIGTSFQECLRAAGGCTVDDPTLLVSGVMMGGVSKDLLAPVAKTTAGLIVLPSDHYLVRRKTSSREIYTRIGHGQCDQCSFCTELCPRYILGYPIEPHRVMRTLLMTGEAKDTRELVGSVLLRVQHLFTDRLPRGVGSQEHLRGRQSTPAREQAGPHAGGTGATFPPGAPGPSRPRDPHQDAVSTLGTHPLRPKGSVCRTRLGAAGSENSVEHPHWSAGTAGCERGGRGGRGAKIAEVDNDKLGCPVHASVTGRVKSVSPTHIEITTNK